MPSHVLRRISKFEKAHIWKVRKQGIETQTQTLLLRTTRCRIKPASARLYISSVGILKKKGVVMPEASIRRNSFGALTHHRTGIPVVHQNVCKICGYSLRESGRGHPGRGCSCYRAPPHSADENDHSTWGSNRVGSPGSVPLEHVRPKSRAGHAASGTATKEPHPPKDDRRCTLELNGEWIGDSHENLVRQGNKSLTEESPAMAILANIANATAAAVPGIKLPPFPAGPPPPPGADHGRPTDQALSLASAPSAAGSTPSAPSAAPSSPEDDVYQVSWYRRTLRSPPLSLDPKQSPQGLPGQQADGGERGGAKEAFDVVAGRHGTPVEAASLADTRDGTGGGAACDGACEGARRALREGGGGGGDPEGMPQSAGDEVGNVNEEVGNLEVEVKILRGEVKRLKERLAFSEGIAPTSTSNNHPVESISSVLSPPAK
ncbi:unnamed protein product, partial [Discosporangium mesarthrocarpum]